MKSNRRGFIGALSAAPMFVPQRAFGANDRITYAAIATGGRGRYLMGKFKQLGCVCAAVCDVYEPNLLQASKLEPEARKFLDYRELLQTVKTDCVVIASPDHQHAPMLMAALDAKVDVYLEKPLSHSLEQSERMIKAVRSAKQVVQIGMQRRSAPALIEAKKRVDDGLLGRIALVKAQWNWNVAKELDNSALPGKLDWNRFLGTAPARELEPMRFRRWRYFFDYAGGNMTDQGTHLMDVVQWFTKNNAPMAAQASGFVAKMRGSEHPDVFSAVFEYPSMLATWSLDYCNAYQNGWSIFLQGDNGTMILDDAGYVVYSEPWRKTSQPAMEKQAPVPVEAHVQNFLDCMKTRQEPNCPVEVAAAAVAGPHMANKAMFDGRKFIRV
jgi:predicted dehydrogenase